MSYQVLNGISYCIAIFWLPIALLNPASTLALEIMLATSAVDLRLLDPCMNQDGWHRCRFYKRCALESCITCLSRPMEDFWQNAFRPTTFGISHQTECAVMRS